MPEQKPLFHIVSHTHWDREWYRGYQSFRLQLVDLVDHLLDILDKDPDYKFFTLDGQTIVLDDYLEIKPQNKERLKKYIESGRVLVGPWHILPDEFLVSGEATIRNLMFGSQKAAAMGGCMKVGYLPDPFGHISQMPQILNGFGINNFIFTRGIGLSPKTEFWWESPDGSRVLAINQRNGYCNAMSLPSGGDDILKKFDMLYLDLVPFASTRHVLVNNGCDHLEPQPEIPDILKTLKSRWPKAEVIHSTFPQFVESILKDNPELATFRGELRDNTRHFLLYGILSSRMYLKQANERCQTLLEKTAEPLNSMAWLAGLPYPQEALHKAWDYLIQNHPHDSICGCSIDEVHDQMMTRFDWSREISQNLSLRAHQALAPHIDTTSLEGDEVGLVIYNPTNWARQEVFTTEVLFPEGYRVKGVRVFDSEGIEHLSQLLEAKSCINTVLNPQQVPSFPKAIKVTLAFETGVIPAGGYAFYRVKPYQIAKPIAGVPIADGRILENEYIRLAINSNGSFDLLDKKTGYIFESAHIFEDGGDMGDEYNYSPPMTDQTFTTVDSDPEMELIANSPLFATVKVTHQLQVPTGISSDRKSRKKELTPFQIVSFITVNRNSPRVDIKTEIDNQVTDHRLRVLFPAMLATNYSYAESQFDVVQRPITPPTVPNQDCESIPATHPQQSYVSLSDDKVGLTVINQGLPEYEIIDSPGRAIALTLLRSVQWLSNDDLLTRCSDAGPRYETPGAQCLGKQTFHYAVYVHPENWEKSQAYRYAHLFNEPLVSYMETKHQGSFPAVMSFVRIEPENILLSALKKSDREDKLVVRVWNTGTLITRGRIVFFRPIKSAWLANMNEEPVREIVLDKNQPDQISLDINAKQIISLLIELN